MVFMHCEPGKRIRPDGFVEHEIVLRDHRENDAFANVNLYIPAEFDTLLTWYHSSDCACCGIQKYRLTNSKSCLLQETGFFSLPNCKDSVDRLTIEHQCVGRSKMKMDRAWVHDQTSSMERKNNDIGYPPIVWNNNKLEKIHGNEFWIQDYIGQEPYSDRPFKQIVASTIFHDTWIGFRFECLQDDCSGFSEKAYQMLNSIQLDTL
jgi:hypothetical protein